MASAAPLEGALQILSVSEDGTSFELHEKALDAVLRQVPDGMMISVVSVVGAFRTGKSFLLDLFLRYLRWCAEHATDGDNDDDRWLEGDSAGQLEGNASIASPPPYSAVPAQAGAGEAKATADAASVAAAAVVTSARAGFAWRGGRKRMTQGIWLWSRPFVRKIGSGEQVAVLLMDTQGMFDSETDQMLTTCIFGLSTLISSYQVYNLQSQVQEDNLQHLALFTEYGRRVLEAQQRPRASGATEQGASEDAAICADDVQRPPFQRLELLVRDATLCTRDTSDEAALERQRTEYLADVLQRTHNRDLATVRDQIHRCFASVSLYLLPHPGFKVTEEDGPFDGSIAEIRAVFRTTVARYIRRVFCENLEAKVVAGRAVTAPQLARYVTAYATLFQERHGLPEASTLLEATSAASNRIAYEDAIAVFDRGVADFFKAPFVGEGDARVALDAAAAAAMATFDKLANFGSDIGIARFRTDLETAIASRTRDSLDRNRERDPMRVLGPVAAALAVALAAWLLRQVLDFTCGPWLTVCQRGSQMFAFIYSAIILVLAATAYAQRRMLAKQTAFLAPIAAQLYGVLAGAAQEQLQRESGSLELLTSSRFNQSERLRSDDAGESAASGAAGEAHTSPSTAPPKAVATGVRRRARRVE